jgi:putative membrane protein
MKTRLMIGALFATGLTTALVAEQKSPKAADDEIIANQSPEQKFVSCSTRNNLFEIQAGKLIAEKATNSDIKKMAQMMVDDHTKAQEQLKETAQKSNIQVPEKLLSWQQSKLDFISRVPIEDLQTEYSFHLVAAHQMAILQTQHALTKLQDGAIKQLAENQVRDLRGHLQHAKTLASTFTGGRGDGLSGEPTGPRDADQKDNAVQPKAPAAEEQPK